MYRLRTCLPMDRRYEKMGLMMPKTRMVGVRKRKIVAASVHFGPSTT